MSSFHPPRAPTTEPEGLVLEPGRVIAGKYLLERRAGFGGMSEVWVATNRATDAPVCVKILARASEEESIERFRREAHAAAKLSHRAIVRVFDLVGLDVAGEIVRRGTPRAYAIVMELLHGETLGDLLLKRGKLPLDDALDLFLPVISALAHAHRAYVIHRDLKPDNIFLAQDPDGHVAPKVLDFGVSKLGNADAITHSGVVVGTPSFMSPEQARGARVVDARSDVFSAATLLYLMLSGTNPFEGETFVAVVDALKARVVPPLSDIPEPIWAVIERALRKDPAARFADATEMGIALRKAAGRRATTDSSPSLPELGPPSEPRDSIASTTRSGIPLSVEPPPLRPRWIPAALGLGAVSVIAAVLLWPRSVPPRLVGAAAASEAPASSMGGPAVSAARVEAATPAPPSAPIAPITPIASVAPPVASVPASSAAAPAPAPTVLPTTSAPKRRKPGAEPNNARDPGF